MTNIVDTSEETIQMEFEAAEKEIGTEEQAEQPSAQEQQQAQLDEAQRQAETAMAAGLISTSLAFAISSFSGVAVNQDITTKAAESYAIVIIKYFPGGIFGLLDQYKEELAALTATFMLVKAVSDAKAEQAEKEAKKQEENAQKPTRFTPEQTEKNKGENDGRA